MESVIQTESTDEKIAEAAGEYGENLREAYTSNSDSEWFNCIFTWSSRQLSSTISPMIVRLLSQSVPDVPGRLSVTFPSSYPSLLDGDWADWATHTVFSFLNSSNPEVNVFMLWNHFSQSLYHLLKLYSVSFPVSLTTAPSYPCSTNDLYSSIILSPVTGLFLTADSGTILFNTHILYYCPPVEHNILIVDSDIRLRITCINTVKELELISMFCSLKSSCSQFEL